MDPLLELLSGSPDERAGVLLSSEEEQREFGLLDQALREWDQRPPKVSPALSRRLRDLPGNDSGALSRREAPPIVRVLGTGGSAERSRVVGESRRVSQRRRARATTARLSRGASVRRSKITTSRRRTGASLRVADSRSSSSSQYVFGAVAAAAGLLVALAAALHMSSDPGPSPHGTQTAQAKKVSEGPRAPLVSDLHGKARPERDPRGERSPEEGAPQAGERGSSEARGTAEESGAQSPAREPSAQRPFDPAPSAGHEPSGPADPEPGLSESPEAPAVGPGTQVREPEAVAAASPRAGATTPRWARVANSGGHLEVDLRRVKGAISLARRGETEFTNLTPKSAQGNLELHPGDRIRSRSGGFVSLDEGAYELCLDAETELVLRGAAAGPRLGLASGRLHCEVRSLPSGERFTVATGRGDLSVLGTIFAVEAGATRTRVLVGEGTVALSDLDGREVKIGAGKASEVNEGAPTKPVAFGRRDLAWAARFAPRRQLLYSVDFDDRKLGGFRGELASDARSGRSLVLSPTEDNPYWGLEGSIPAGRIAGFRPGPDVYVQFSLFVEDSAPVLFQSYNDKQKKEFKAGFHHPGGYWRTFTVPLLSLSTYVDPGANPVHVGDLFTDLEIYVGNAGSRQRVLLDEVQIYRRVYR